jgi:hypothetical protein
MLPKFATIDRFYDKISAYTTKEELSAWSEKYGEAILERAIDYTLNRLAEGLEIGNVPGYIQHLLKQPSMTTPPVAPLKESKSKGSKRNKELLKQEYQRLMQEYQTKQDHVLGSIVASYPDQASILQQKAVELARKVLPSATVNSQVTQGQFVKLAREHFPAHFDVLQNMYEVKIANIRQAIDAHD